MLNKFLSNKDGFTLVEVLASMVLLTLILTTFLMMFGMGAKTNVASETIFNSTYEVQNELEKIIELSSRSTAPENRLSIIQEELGYERQTSVLKNGVTWGVLSKDVQQLKMNIYLEKTEARLARVLVELVEEPNTNPKAQMETILTWEGEAP
ncbi:prepilin-type N-terminal cleavage/methylation domain-containing protein [Planococcus maritimus]|nr:prepilin-type N-terminal cleavage/methylation domain-containing protein [Planococcus sp. SK3692]MDE4085036.1 prepilin-type N-terminal cleavage/methylation domain-containing protein [Planococcus maritimus]